MFVRDLAARGENVLFVGTKKQAGDSVREEATRAGAYYVNARWLGGMMTNFNTIRRRIERDRRAPKRVAQQVLAGVRRRADDPRLLVLGTFERPRRTQKLEEHRLADVFRILRGLQVGEAQAQDEIRVRVDEPACLRFVVLSCVHEPRSLSCRMVPAAAGFEQRRYAYHTNGSPET